MPSFEGDFAMSQTVHIVDDDASLCCALQMTLDSVGLNAKAYSSVSSFLDAVEPGSAGCLILDVRLPGISGLDFQARFSSYGVAMPVIMMTGYGDIPMTVRAMKAGAVDFLSKPFRDQELLDAVSKALQIEEERSSDQINRNRLAKLHDRLSPREREVMDHVVTGQMNKQIAFDLGISEETVKIHRAAAMRKMEVKSLADLVRAADRLRAAIPSPSPVLPRLRTASKMMA